MYTLHTCSLHVHFAHVLFTCTLAYTAIRTHVSASIWHTQQYARMCLRLCECVCVTDVSLHMLQAHVYAHVRACRTHHVRHTRTLACAFECWHTHTQTHTHTRTIKAILVAKLDQISDEGSTMRVIPHLYNLNNDANNNDITFICKVSTWETFRTIAEKPSERPLPPKQICRALSCRVAACLASAINSARGMRSSAVILPPGPISKEKSRTCVLYWQIVSQLAPSYLHCTDAPEHQCTPSRTYCTSAARSAQGATIRPDLGQVRYDAERGIGGARLDCRTHMHGYECQQQPPDACSCWIPPVFTPTCLQPHHSPLGKKMSKFLRRKFDYDDLMSFSGKQLRGARWRTTTCRRSRRCTWYCGCGAVLISFL